jgi:hypothetical protein
MDAFRAGCIAMAGYLSACGLAQRQDTASDASVGATDAAQDAAACLPPQGCESFVCGDSCYALCPAATWEQADLACQASGGHLACINEASENECIFTSAVADPSQRVSIGLTQDSLAAEPTAGWGWVCEEPFTFEKWSASEPNNELAEEDCAQFFGPSGVWNDAPCWIAQPFVCELPGS